MKLRVVREPSVDGCTFGSLYLDGAWFGWTLEDELREVPGQPVPSWKVKGETAIPGGTYPLTLTLSQRFKVVLPLVGDVPGFSGIRIHAGNSQADTEGCLLVGRTRSSKWIGSSKVALEALLVRLNAAPGAHTIWFENPQ